MAAAKDKSDKLHAKQLNNRKNRRKTREWMVSTRRS
jgi:hypothetical protein